MLVIADNRQSNFLTEDIRTLLNTCTLRLYKNNRTPDPADRVGDYTESTFAGYAAQAITAFPAPTQASGILSEMLDAVHTFLCTAGGPENVYGYFVTLPDGSLFFAERYSAAPYAISAGGAFFVQTYMSTIQQV